MSALTRIGRYRVLGPLGAGGMAEVFLAEHEGPAGFSRRVVIKKVHPRLLGDDIYVQLFLREARIASRLRHANVVQVLELGEENGEYFIVMELLEGLSLRTVALRSWLHQRTLPLEVILSSLADAALGLHHAHTLTDDAGRPGQLVHRDISPDNMMLCRDGTTKVLDFGLAKSTGESADDLTSSSVIRGKVSYMSPEQLENAPLDGRCDLFALGATAYWMLTGKSPFKGNTDALTIHNVLAVEPPPPSEVNPAIPSELDALLLRMVSKRREARPADALEVHERLIELAGAVPTGRAARFAEELMALAPLEATERLKTLEGFFPCAPEENDLTLRLTLAEAASLERDRSRTDTQRVDHTTLSSPPLPPTEEAPSLLSQDDTATGVTEPSRESFAKDATLTGPKSGRPSSVALPVVAGLLGAAVGGLFFFFAIGPTDRVAAGVVTQAPVSDPVVKLADVPAADETPPPDDVIETVALPIAEPPAPIVDDEASEPPPLETAEDREPAAAASSRRARQRTVRLVAPANISWLYRGERVGKGSDSAKLPARVTSVQATDPETGGVSEVRVVDGVARYADVGVGKAFFMAEPWANVRVGKRALGTTPFEAVPLPVGQYTAVFEWKGERKTQRFRVRSGATTQVTQRMR